MKARAVTTLLAGVCALMFSGMAFAAPPADVGFEFPLTGPYGAYAEEMKRGVEMATEDINAQGGVLGKPVKVIIRDSELKTDVALRRMKEYADAGIKVVGGNLSGGISMVVNQWAAKKKILYMSCSHNSMGQGKDWSHYGFTAGVKSYMTGAALADYCFENLGKKWMIIAVDYRWGHDEVAAFLHKSNQMGGEFLGAIYTPVGTRDFSAYVPTIMAKNPDFLVLSVWGSDLVSAIKQCGELGLTKKIKLALPKTAMPLMKECGSAYDENVIGAATWYWKLAEKYPKAKSFVAAYEKKYGRPPAADVDSGYVAAMSLYMAMNKAGTKTDVEKIVAALEELKWDLHHGPEQFRKCDHVREQTIVILEGLGSKAQGWDTAKVIGEVPASKTMLPCDQDRSDSIYGPIREKLPGK